MRNFYQKIIEKYNLKEQCEASEFEERRIMQIDPLFVIEARRLPGKGGAWWHFRIYHKSGVLKSASIDKFHGDFSKWFIRRSLKWFKK